MSQKKNSWVKVSDDGFSINLSSGVRNVKWSDIEEINAYKVDLFTIDEICFDIVLTETVLTITEGVEGWVTFTDKLKVILPGFDKEWFAKVVFPAFQTNFTTIFKK